MNHSLFLATAAFSLLTLAPCSMAGDFRVEGSSFVLDGQAFQIRAGEIHYPRVPRAEWRNRIQMARAMGLNTISTYAFWNFHESKRGEFDFAGEKDLAEFVRLCGVEAERVAEEVRELAGEVVF